MEFNQEAIVQDELLFSETKFNQLNQKMAFLSDKKVIEIYAMLIELEERKIKLLEKLLIEITPPQ